MQESETKYGQRMGVMEVGEQQLRNEQGVVVLYHHQEGQIWVDAATRHQEEPMKRYRDSREGVDTAFQR